MDANQQTFWMLSDGTQFDFNINSGGCTWDKQRRVLKLASIRNNTTFPADRTAARRLANQPPMTMDKYGTWATTNEDRSQVVAYGAFSDPVTIYSAPAGQQILDLSMGIDDTLFIVVGLPETSTSVVMLDTRERWKSVVLNAEGYTPNRVVADPYGGAWVLDRARQKAAQIKGVPLRRGPGIDYCPGTTRPCEENPDPPRLILREDLGFPEDREIIAIASNGTGRIAFLLWLNTELREAEIIFLSKTGFSEPFRLSDAGAPFSLGWIGGNRWAVLYEGLNEAIVYEFPDSGRRDEALELKPVGDKYPLTGWSDTPFLNALTQPVNYRSARNDDIEKPWPLHQLSLPGLKRSATIKSEEPFDSGHHGTAWHRIYIEASIPPGTGIKIFVSAADNRIDLETAQEMEHRFGTFSDIKSDNTSKKEIDDTIPRGVWLNEPSEIPLHPGFLQHTREKNHAGLFTVLVQRPGRAVRTLSGRFLQVRLELLGNGQSGPEIAAIRIYAPRFSYLDRYLPELYRETLFGKEADAIGPATGPDFLQRFLGIFEGILTPIEDKAASAHLMTDPITAPPEALEWLSSWIGLTLLPGLSMKTKRRMIKEATKVYRKRGTLKGLSLALNIITGDKVSAGRIVILEDFRLRRTFSTILGADLSDEENPLLMGLCVSGNSYVGDTLFLGEEEKKEFLSLYKQETSETKKEKETVASFFEKLSNRITILVHNEMSQEEFQMVKRVAHLESPAHIAVRILTASNPLLIGLASLVGIDTYLGEPASPEYAVVGKTYIGRGDVVKGKGCLDYRLEGAGAPDVQPGMRRPDANAGDNSDAEYGESFHLNGSTSRAYNGREIEWYHWRRTS